VIRSASFYADGLKLDGDLYVPEDRQEGERRPALVVLSGYTGVKTAVPKVWSPRFVERGLVCLGIDYRGYGASEGERGRLWPQEQVEDVRAAVSWLEQQPEVDPDRIGLFGWAQGGAVAIVEAADDERVRSTVAVHPQGDTGRVTRRLHSDESWAALQERFAEDRRERSRTGKSAITSPFEGFPLDDATDNHFRSYDHTPNYGAYDTPVSYETFEAMLRFRAELVVDRIAPRGLLLFHGGANTLHLPSESEGLYARAGEPKELVILEGKPHLYWSEHEPETYNAVADQAVAFCRKVWK
jgi:pimeloyl-ACP methyl ester carboxylesterase